MNISASASLLPIPVGLSLHLVLVAVLSVCRGYAEGEEGFSTLFSFNGANGAQPRTGLTLGSDGCIYGTTYSGGEFDRGVVFKITTNGAFSTLFSFTGTNGAYPAGKLFVCADGTLYGTTAAGGIAGAGTVFKLTTDGLHTVLTSLRYFDGTSPFAGVVQGSDGQLYGTATGGGGFQEKGSIFRVSTNGVFTNLLSFTTANGYGNGAQPRASLTEALDGSFYGTTLYGGASAGTIFRITTDGQFRIVSAFDGANGAYPTAELTRGRDGSFFGTTSGGGDYTWGTIYRVTPNGFVTTLHMFTGGEDGGDPHSGLLEGEDGAIYGVTYDGGTYRGGILFRVVPSGAFERLVTFGGTNGSRPICTLVRGGDGAFYGTTLTGGAHDAGTVFRLAVPINPPPPARSVFVTQTSETLGIADHRYTFPSTIAQEFVSPAGQFDCVGLYLRYFFSQDRQIVIREAGLTGAVVAISSGELTLPEVPHHIFFTFSQPVNLSPAALYVMEFVTDENSTIGVTRDVYPEGRLLLSGVPDPELDLAFSIGWFVPQVAPPSARLITTMERQSALLLPAAIFTNDHIVDYRGAILTVSLDSQSSVEDDLDLESSGSVLNTVEFHGQVIGTVTKTVLPHTLTVTFNSHATAAGVQHTMRQVSYVNYSHNPPPNRRIAFKFGHPLGATTIPLTVEILNVNEPPVAEPRLVFNRPFLDDSSVFIARKDKAIVILDASQSFDVDAASLSYAWADGNGLLPSQGRTVTNNFSVGLHSVSLTVTDEEGLSDRVSLTVEVLSPREAISRIQQSFETKNVPPEWQRRLAAPLRQARLALAQHRRSAAKIFLQVFQRRATAFGEIDSIVGPLFVDSAQTVIDGLSR